MLRREFFSFTAGGVVSTEPIPQPADLAALISQLEAAVLAELPGVREVRVSFDADDKKVPLMIMAFRI